MTSLVLIALFAIVACLAIALVYLLRGDRGDAGRSRKMVWALGARVGLSIGLFACLLIAWKLGYIQPTGIPHGT